MLLRTRITVLAAVTLPIVAAAVALPAWLLLEERGNRIAALRLAQQEAEVARVLDAAARPLGAVLDRAAAEEALAAALARRDAEEASRRLLGLVAAGPEGRIEAIGRGDQLLAAAPGPRSGEPMLAGAALFRDLAPGREATGVEADATDGALRLVAVRRLDAALLAHAMPFDRALRALSAALRAEVLLADLEGRPLAAPDAPGWALLGAGGADAETPRLVEHEGRAILVVPTELRSPAGLPVARLMVLRDATAEARREDLATLSALALLLGIGLLAGVLLHRMLRAALDPLTGLAGVLRAVAAGDAYASTSVPARRDEVGEIAAAFEALRASGLALGRHETRERLARERVIALIRANLARLAAVLDPAERAAVEALLRRAEAGSEAGGQVLAEAFGRMAEGVLDRHGRMDALLAERTRDLETVRAALAQRVAFDRMVEELDVARRLQMASLPTEFPTRPSFSLHAEMRPAKEVGGDFYDVMMLPGERLALMVGDASGKGVAAAIFVAMTRSLLRAAVTRGASPAEALAQANDVLAADNPSMMFATAFVAILDCRTGAMTYASAGHDAPRRLAADGAEAPLHGRGAQGVALGVMEDIPYADQAARLDPGDALLLFTDGVTEADRADGALFGEARLAGTLAAARGAAPAETVLRIAEAVEGFAAGAPQADDITLLCLAFHGGAAAPAPEIPATALA